MEDIKLGFTKLINLDKEAYDIWADRFGRYSQSFSKFVCDKLKEENLKFMSIEKKRKYIKEKEEKLKREMKELESEKKNFKSEEKINKKEIDIEKKQEEELNNKKLKRQEEIKKNFFEFLELEYKLNKNEIKKLYKEFQKQEKNLSIVQFLREKFENNQINSVLDQNKLNEVKISKI